MNKKDFNNISMNGRLAYQLMCLESYLVGKYSDRDFTKLMSFLWQVTSDMWWNEFADYVMDLTPSALFEYNSYDKQEWLILSKEQYNELTPLLKDLDDEVSDLFGLLREQAYVYEGTIVPTNTKESIAIIFQTIEILENNNIKLPDIAKVQFSTIDQFNGWGDKFDGKKLSIILK